MTATVHDDHALGNLLGLEGIDHLEWWVGNARAFSAFMASGFGFDIVAYAGPETGVPDRLSYVLEQGEVRFVVTSALDPASEIGAHVRAHGDGVRDVAFTVADAAAVYDAALQRGGVGLRPLRVDEDEGGKLLRATIAAYGLCWSCYQRPGVRENYGYRPKPLGKKRGKGLDSALSPALKGEMERRIVLYARRAAAELPLFEDAG